MIEGRQIEAVFTDDESELVTIINGLEEQANQLEPKAKEAKSAASLMFLGASTYFVLNFYEQGDFNKLEYRTISAGLAIGALERFVKHRKLVSDIRQKNRLANKLKQELEPTDLERYEQRSDFVLDDEDEGDEYYFPDRAENT